jgi:hypothetical protein
VRGGSFALYWVLLYFAFERTFRERDFDAHRFLRELVYASVAFVAFMAVTRVLNRPFDRNPPSGSLAVVPTTQGNFRRDYGFGSAYTIYPAVALLALGASFYATRYRARWIVVSIVCLAATLATLVRGNIYGFAIGVGVLGLSARAQRRGRRILQVRRGALLGLVAGIAVAAVFVSAVAPRYGIAIVERSIPFVHQTAGSEANAQYRTHALTVGIDTARAHPLGLGFLDAVSLSARHHIDPGLLDHSGPAAVLAYSGWLGAAAVLAALIALVVESRRPRAGPPWVHPVFVALAVLFVVSSFASSGIFGQSWVVGVGALLLASRFHAAPRTAA